MPERLSHFFIGFLYFTADTSVTMRLNGALWQAHDSGNGTLWGMFPCECSKANLACWND